MRVRAINTANTTGAWSNVLNTTTGEVTTVDIADGAVTTVKIAVDAISGVTTAFTAALSSFLPADPSVVDIQTLTFTATGEKVVIIASFHAEQVAGSSQIQYWIYRDSTIVLGPLILELPALGPDDNIAHVTVDDAPPAGSVTYDLRANSLSGGATLKVRARGLMTMEIKR
jgi:hypothetical protein